MTVISSRAVYSTDDKNTEYGLPDAEIFYENGDLADGSDLEAGWYFWYCFPGCLPDSQPVGPFASFREARTELYNDSVEF